MKAVLISIQPKWCELIASGKKTVEVRKTRPKLETPFKVYIYATKHRDRLKFHKKGSFVVSKAITDKVIGEFVCDEIYQYSTSDLEGQTISDEEMQKLSCLTKKELRDYEYSATPKDYCIYLIGLYGWHISNLVIYDEPKELSEFSKPYGTIRKAFESQFITRPPQSWCFVEELVGDNK